MHRRWIALSLAVPLIAAPTTDGLNRFASDLYHQLAQTRGNIVVSPLSISTALAMTLAGARGQTAQEMTTVLRTPPDAALLDQLTRAGNTGGDQLLLAQSLWVDRELRLLPDFIAANQQQFHASPEPASFSTDPEAARAVINKWASDHTKGKIEGLFGPRTLTRATRLVLASAVYFNGKWQSQFDASATKPAPFQTGSSTIQTPFMNQSGRFLYTETANAQVLELPYAGGSLAFDVILPKTGTPLSTLEQALRSTGFSAWLGQFMRKQINVALPKFRVTADYSLRPTLSAMGMANAFSPAADFSGIDGHRDLSISQVVHKAYIDVSEEGTEAAAATGIGVALTAFAPPITFRADHPFLFLIRDTTSGAILFAGRLENPGAKIVE
jgi:serpin B